MMINASFNKSGNLAGNKITVHNLWYMMIEMKIGMLGNPAGNGVSFLSPKKQLCYKRTICVSYEQ
jgi:hypothetical protein